VAAIQIRAQDEIRNPAVVGQRDVIVEFNAESDGDGKPHRAQGEVVFVAFLLLLGKSEVLARTQRRETAGRRILIRVIGGRDQPDAARGAGRAVIPEKLLRPPRERDAQNGGNRENQ